VLWQDNPYYAHWHLGQVISDVECELAAALAQAQEKQKQYLPRQIEAFEYTFYSEAGSTAAQRGADAIAAFIRRGAPSLSG
jgi:hypothetical protein